MLEYRIARPEEEADVLDFINLVFSQTRVPHHFDQLLPKAYAYPGYAPYHYVAVENGKIRACVAMLKNTLRLDSELSLTVGFVGSVSVHEKSRGEGHMKKLMGMAIEEAKEKGYDLLALGGQRQRYGYWDFAPGGVERVYTLNKNNIRHAMKDIDESAVSIREITAGNDGSLSAVHGLMNQQDMLCSRDRERLLETMHSWNNSLFCLEEQGRFLGYLYGKPDAIFEMALVDEEKLPCALKAWMQGKDSCQIHAPLHKPALSAYLQSIAEAGRINDGKKYRILNWPNVIEKCLSYKQKKFPQPAGRAVVEIQGEGRYAIAVQGGNVTAKETLDAPQFSFTPCQAVSFFFSPFTLMEDVPPLIKSWLPLPLHFSSADTF